MKAFIDFWQELGWLANLVGICVVIFSFFSIFIKRLGKSKSLNLNSINKKRHSINSKMTSDDYQKWQLDFFESTYSESEFVNLYGRKYPATLIRSDNSHKYPFKSLCTLSQEKFSEVNLDKQQKKYLDFLGDSVKRPKMKGFSLKEIILNEDGSINNIIARISNYEQNLVTSHILEIELYEAYKKNKNKGSIQERLRYRNNYHGLNSPSKAILLPNNSYPLISVQGLVIYKDYSDPENQEWKAVIAQRRENVSIKPGLWQFQPAGGFEIFGSENDTNEALVSNQFDIKNALLRELAEELYDVKEFEFCFDGRDSRSILSEKHISLITTLIAQQKASIEFLGIVTDLTVLRHEASFLIIIDDEKYSEYPILGSSESTNIESLKINNLKDIFSTEKVHASSAGLLQLAKESEKLKELKLGDVL